MPSSEEIRVRSFHHYQELALSTRKAIDPPGWHLYPVLGYQEEILELRNAISEHDLGNGQRDTEPIKKELGDFLWYWFVFHYDIGTDFSDERFKIENFGLEPDLDAVQPSSPGACRAAYEILDTDIKLFAGFLKRLYRDRKGRFSRGDLSDSERSALSDWFYRVIADAHRIGYHYNLTMRDILDANISKLLDRKKRGVIGGSGDNR